MKKERNLPHKEGQDTKPCFVMGLAMNKPRKSENLTGIKITR